MNEYDLWGPWPGEARAPVFDPHPGLTADQRKALRRWTILALCALGGLVAGFYAMTGAAING